MKKKKRKTVRRFPFIIKVLISFDDRHTLALLKKKTGKAYSALGREAFQLLFEKYSEDI